ncbi:hypothetical protein WA158_008194 [Blastocystis sp. Blastoise]
MNAYDIIMDLITPDYIPPLWYCIYPTQIVRNIFQCCCGALVRPILYRKSIKKDKDLQHTIAESFIKYYKSFCIVTTGQRVLEHFMNLFVNKDLIQKCLKHVMNRASSHVETVSSSYYFFKTAFLCARQSIYYEASYLLLSNFHIYNNYCKKVKDLDILIQENTETHPNTPVDSEENYKNYYITLKENYKQQIKSNLLISFIRYCSSFFGSLFGSYICPGIGSAIVCDISVALAFALLKYPQNADVDYLPIELNNTNHQ